MVAHAPPRILVVADNLPTDAAGLSRLLAQADWRFVITTMQNAPQAIGEQDLAAAILFTPHTYYNGHQKDLIRVLDELVERQIGAIILTTSGEDLELANKMMSSSEGLMAVPATCNRDELTGRLAGLAAARPIIDQLQRENHMLRKFDNGLNHQITQIDEEMRLAARLQVDFLPRTLPAFNKVSFNVLFRPASYVSGDIYDATRVDEDHVAFFIADAVGHGMPAALLTIFIKRTLQTKEITKGGYRIIPPDEALAHLNNELVTQQLSLCQFVTMAYGILNTKTLELQWARAGHPLPMHLHANGKAEELDLDGALLGVFENEQFPLQKVQLRPGDSILLYSDGFESAFTDTGGRGGGGGVINERYRTEFAKLAGPRPTERFNALVQQLDQQEGSLHQRDDLTALLLTIAAEPG
ncbi:MAG TPA: PP2C family protein-serine/threonine phosphatase [Phycisphaerae bacterium]|nr:PP2C family protein-serine/threonine phosphatase [Phycisphaerae bacterium]